MEQRPNYSNLIRLGHERDVFGRVKAVIDWRIRGEDIEDFRLSRSMFLDRWSLLAPDLKVRSNEEGDEVLDKPHDAYHPVGTCRIGRDSAAVARFDLRVRGTENLFVLSTAVFPGAGSANPTFNLLCFAEKLAAQLARGSA